MTYSLLIIRLVCTENSSQSFMFKSTSFSVQMEKTIFFRSCSFFLNSESGLGYDFTQKDLQGEYQIQFRQLAYH